MKLHSDKNAFAVILNAIHDRTGYRTDVLEKDYYVVLVLKELSEFQKEGLPAYFKGGTALYKALKTTNSFRRTLICLLIQGIAAALKMTNGLKRRQKNTVY